MNGRMYTVPIPGTASPATAFDFWELVPAAAKPIRIRRIRIAQTSELTTEEEQLAITVVRGNTTTGSGGSSPTPLKLCSSDSAAGFASETMNTTVASAGSPESLMEDAWNTRAGYDMAFAPEESPEAVNGERICVRSSAPADAVTIRGTIWVEELG